MTHEPGADPRLFAFCLVDRFSLMSVVAAIDTLRIANRLMRRQVYRWQLATHDGAPVTASSGITITPDVRLDDLQAPSICFVAAGLDPWPEPAASYRRALHRLARQGAAIGGLSTGTFVLAASGLLAGYRCTVHWENRPAFQEAFPDIECTGKVYEIDRDRYTSSGGAAAVDMMLAIVAEQFGGDLVLAIANQLQHDRVRTGKEDQRLGDQGFLEPLPQRLKGAIAIMGSHLDAPLATATIAYRMGVSARQLERLFQRYLRQSPARYYMKLRLERARDLLLHSNVPVLEVAVATGFTSSSYFSQCYRELFAETPSATRHAAMLAGERRADGTGLRSRLASPRRVAT